MRISDWSSDVCSSDLQELTASAQYSRGMRGNGYDLFQTNNAGEVNLREKSHNDNLNKETTFQIDYVHPFKKEGTVLEAGAKSILRDINSDYRFSIRSEEHTSELQTLMRSSYAVLCLKTKKRQNVKNTQ